MSSDSTSSSTDPELKISDIIEQIYTNFSTKERYELRKRQTRDEYRYIGTSEIHQTLVDDTTGLPIRSSETGRKSENGKWAERFVKNWLVTWVTGIEFAALRPIINGYEEDVIAKSKRNGYLFQVRDHDSESGVDDTDIFKLSDAAQVHSLHPVVVTSTSLTSKATRAANNIGVRVIKLQNLTEKFSEEDFKSPKSFGDYSYSSRYKNGLATKVLDRLQSNARPHGRY